MRFSCKPFGYVCAIVLLAVLAIATPGQAATFAMKRGLNLDIWTTWPGEDKWGDRETLLPYPEWRKTLTAADLADLKAAGFDFLRMPVDPAPFLSAKTEAFRDRLYASVLDSARIINAAGLKVVVDMHLISGGMETVMNDPAAFDRYLDIVRQMATTLADEDPTLVAFELMNEPVVDCEAGQDSWSERRQRLFAAARASATRLTLVLTGACYSSAEMLAKTDPSVIPDDNIIWTFHSYNPFLLTHQGATWAGDFISYVTGLPYPPYSVPRAELDAALEAIRQRMQAEAPFLRRAGMLAYLDEEIARIDSEEKLRAVMANPFEIAAAWAEKHGIRPENIYLGEFGIIRQEYQTSFVMPASSRAAYLKDMIGLAEARGYSWSIWDYGGAFGIVDEFEGRKAEPDVMEMIRALPAR